MDKKKTVIFKLESSTWETKRSQNRSKINDCPQAILRVSMRVQETLKAQASKVYYFLIFLIFLNSIFFL